MECSIFLGGILKPKMTNYKWNVRSIKQLLDSQSITIVDSSDFKYPGPSFYSSTFELEGCLTREV